MPTYKFYDTDLTGKQEYDISGDAYRSLLDTIFLYCSSFSIVINKSQVLRSAVLEDFESFRIPITKNVQKVYSHYGFHQSNMVTEDCGYEIRHYKLTIKSQHLIRNVTDSIFQWTWGWGNKNPDDPAFFRSDGSTFFSSVIHEGECTLTPLYHENVDAVISRSNWILLEE